MLSEASVHGVLPATDIQRARKFYEGVLGLESLGAPAGPDSAEYGTKQGKFLVYQTTAPGAAATSLGFVVDDLAAEMADMRSKGVVFEEFDLPGLKTVDGVVEMGGRKAAWFRDSEGNTISLSQM